MDPNILYIIIGVAALLLGLVAGKLIFAKNTRKKVEEAELQSQTILKEAELRADTIRESHSSKRTICKSKGKQSG